MGAQKSTELEELSIVVDISRDNNIALATSPVSIVKKMMPVTGNKESNHCRSSSGTSAESSEGTEAIVDAVNHENDEVMQEAVVEDASGDMKVSGPQVDEKQGSDASQRDVIVLSSSPILNGLAHDKDAVSKPKGNRKRKKTVHYMNSRVPHSVPILESDDGSDSPGSPEEAEEIPVRQAPRAAASKLKAMVPVGDKMPKPPRNAKELMATGLLTGHHVRCSCRGEQLTGTLQDMGVVCDCRNCKGEQVVSISAFEAHSGSTSHHPSDNIYLENGKNLRDILSAGQEAADCGDNIFRALKHAIGEIQGIVKRTIVCAKCGSCEGGNLISCKGARCSVVYHPECIGIPGSHRGDWFCAKCEKIMKKPHANNLKVKRSTPGGAEREDPRAREKDLTVLARSARDAHVHKALFLPGGLADGTELGYYARNQCILTGVKRGGGICCSCCDKEISCSAFELHAGCEARRNPYGSILLADGRSLKDVCKELADQNKLGERAKHVSRAGEINSCVECGENGDQKWCHGCDLSWCRDCAEETFDLGAEKESDKWYCRICKKDNVAVLKSAQKVSGRTVNGGNIIVADDRNRRVRHFQAPDSVGGCAICKKWNLSKSGFDGMTMLVCDQCGREYHVGCLKKAGMVDINELPEGEWFCQRDCQDIDEILKQLVANGPESLSDSIISELLESRQQQGAAKEKAESSSPTFGWQILCGRSGNAVNGQTLAEAVDIFTECSDPIKDATTGRNLIPLMVHSRRLKDYDFEGVFCVVLKLNEKVVSAALLQIFGRQIAEVPLIATSLAHQGQGFCKALMTTIERLLGVLSVEYLVLPTAKDAESIWVNKFGFRRMDDEQLAKIRMTIRLMTFTGTCMLEKAITPMTVI